MPAKPAAAARRGVVAFFDLAAIGGRGGAGMPVESASGTRAQGCVRLSSSDAWANVQLSTLNFQRSKSDVGLSLKVER
jgi:hypothetical protein